MEKINCEDLVEPGYYWWLPKCFENEPEKALNWSVISWHPLNKTKQKSGICVGPLKEPVFNKE